MASWVRLWWRCVVPTPPLVGALREELTFDDGEAAIFGSGAGDGAGRGRCNLSEVWGGLRLLHGALFTRAGSRVRRLGGGQGRRVRPRCWLWSRCADRCLGGAARSGGGVGVRTVGAFCGGVSRAPSGRHSQSRPRRGTAVPRRFSGHSAGAVGAPPNRPWRWSRATRPTTNCGPVSLAGIGPAGSHAVRQPQDKQEALRQALFGEVGSPAGPFELRAVARVGRGVAPAADPGPV